LNENLQNGLAPSIEPVQILEQNDRRLAPAPRLRNALYDRKELPQALIGSHLGDGALGIRDPEEVEHQRQSISKLFVEQQHPPGDLRARGFGAVLFRDAEEGAEQFQDREEGDELPVGDPVRLVNRDPTGTAALGELVTEPALPEPWVGDHSNDLSTASNRPRKCGLEARDLVGPPDEP
jgi:hypothetical protein